MSREGGESIHYELSAPAHEQVVGKVTVVKKSCPETPRDSAQGRKGWGKKALIFIILCSTRENFQLQMDHSCDQAVLAGGFPLATCWTPSPELVMLKEQPSGRQDLARTSSKLKQEQFCLMLFALLR